MFAAMKENAAKRKAARKVHTQEFKARIAEINEKRDIELALIQLEKQANREKLSAQLAENTRVLKAAWSK